MNVLVRRRTNKAARLATVVLLLIAFVSNSMMYAYAAGGEAFSFAIGETTFTVTPGAAPFVTSTTEGAVEIATDNGAVIWANQSGIITGYSSGLFGPDDYCTREQMATMMWRMAKTAGIDMSVTADLDSFPDGEQVSDFAQEALSWCVGNDIISGMGTDGSLDPQGMTRRAHCAVIIVRYMELGSE